MLCFVFAALVVLLDQFIKHWIILTLPLHGEAELIPGLIGLTHYENTGAAFSMLANQRWLLAGISLAATLVLIFVLLRYNEGFWGTLGLAAVLGGTVGNLIDRVFNGFVVDMFVPLFINFAIFNIADIFITLGGITFCIFFVIASFRSPGGEEETPEPEDGPSYVEEDGVYDFQDWEGEDDPDSLTDTKAIPTGRRPSDHISQAGYQQAEPATEDYFGAEPEDADYFGTGPDDGGYTVIGPEDEDYIVVGAENEGYSGAESEAYDPYYTGDLRQDYTEPAYEQDPINASAIEALASLDSLESELSKIDDYDVDAMLREYGFEDDL